MLYLALRPHHRLWLWFLLWFCKGCLDPGHVESRSIQAQVAWLEHYAGLARCTDVIENRRRSAGLVARGEYVARDEIGDVQRTDVLHEAGHARVRETQLQRERAYGRVQAVRERRQGGEGRQVRAGRPARQQRRRWEVARAAPRLHGVAIAPRGLPPRPGGPRRRDGVFRKLVALRSSPAPPARRIPRAPARALAHAEPPYE
jgi:hypothetical protein